MRATAPTRRPHSSHLPSTPESRFSPSGTMPRDYTDRVGGPRFCSWISPTGADPPPPPTSRRRAWSGAGRLLRGVYRAGSAGSALDKEGLRSGESEQKVHKEEKRWQETMDRA